MKNLEVCIIFFVKYPESGKVKTRLAREVGNETAEKLYKNFILDILNEITKVDCHIFIAVDDKKYIFYCQEWLGKRFQFFAQEGRYLGEKMEKAFSVVFHRGYRKAIIIGSDIPEITHDIVIKAFNALNSYDTVIGPTFDGGYYLIGFNNKKIEASIFTGIPWSTDEVFQKTVDKLKINNVKYYILDQLSDIDYYQDLLGYYKRNKEKSYLRTIQYIESNLKIIEKDNIDISIIIPVYHEKEYINQTIDRLYGEKYNLNIEIIVIDGDQTHSTINEILSNDVIKLSSGKGRAIQMNVGAKRAKGRILIFLHADTRLPKRAFYQIIKVINEKHYPAGAFDLKINSNKWIFRLIERNSSLRSRITRIPYGDQVHFFNKNYFTRIGMYKEIPIMEDIEIMQRIKKRKDKIFILPDKVVTSERRWIKEGILRCTLRNWILSTLYYLGVNPIKLERFYK